MGLDRDCLLMLADSKARGVSFENILMIGRQHLGVAPVTVRKVMEHLGCFDASLYNDLVMGKSAPFSDDVFRMLGAKTIDVLDMSPFEGANIIHNLNYPIADKLKNQYDLIFDGGTLEHIFNCPVALKSYMDMLKVGGCLVIGVPGNNWMGHGFYQLSSEFFYRALSPDQGFRVHKMILTAVGPFKRWYEVADPKEISARVELISMFRQMALMVSAEKTAQVEVFQSPPQQQSYEAADHRRYEADAQRAHEAAIRSRPQNFAARGLLRLGQWFSPFKTAWRFYSTMTVWNRKCFKPVPQWPPAISTKDSDPQKNGR